ncbi:putative copper-importing P-type ATPase A [Pseudovibrio axinellae]|uniref:Putative copper-importing P-type ATPase A n=1 Tax=Pseudovibrio axinellae TaxID=989403 RepID=A0A165YLE8_9HYPH|nr:cation-translocating P-type ATPase [Pseudovibrio axinellae]KZL18951.1 putative copper-importing P-type ATPase A [Pseudovibrio axinellae]SEP86501.1 Cu2+-exporting ATPase [Pseudovibrio axinellae]
MSAPESDWAAFVTDTGNGKAHMDLAVDGITCAACMYEIERGLRKLDGVENARVNLSSHRLAVDWDEQTTSPAPIVELLQHLGYKAYPFDPAQVKSRGDAVGKEILRALAVSGFAAMNIMLLSISIWSGNTTDIDPETRSFFHWISALIALPTVVYSGRIFFRSAYMAVKTGRLNMDVPITIGVLLATGLSIWQTIQEAEHAYFDSAVMLLFFLLVGRYCDHLMRRKTRSFAENLATLKAESAAKILEDGSTQNVPLSKLTAGDRVLVRAGERISVDGRISTGTSEVDQSLVTGETLLQSVQQGDLVYAGTMNTHGVLEIEVTAAVKGTLLDEVNSLLETAMEGRSKYVQVADRASQLYAPVVHAAALLTFIGWVVMGMDWQTAMVISISVLIITCPCALGLAIPAVQVVASGLFFKERVLLNAGDAIERLASVDTIVFDKTGTLTLPDATLSKKHGLSADQLELAGRLALSSSHPLSQAIARATGAQHILSDVKEIAGRGVEAVVDGRAVKLGSPAFCGVSDVQLNEMRTQRPDASFVAFQEGSEPATLLPVGQFMREKATETIQQLRDAGYNLEILSGDHTGAVKYAADMLQVADWKANLKPQDKIDRIEALKAQGRKVLMVGDGLNDAPSLAAANVSMSPVSAVHVSQAAADAIFMGDSLTPVMSALNISRKARWVMNQNLIISVIYNLLAVPFAVLGFVTPLVAALAMSGSSIIVTLNAVRLRMIAGASTQPNEKA